MSSRRGNLQPAHQGYRFQDIATAYVLVRTVVARYDEVVVDRKQVLDDRIDDLEVRAAGRRVRRQFKSAWDHGRRLAENDFVAAASSLRIDRLVLTHVRAGCSPADEYRLCATWQPPAADDPLAAMLEPATASPTINGWPARFYRLRGEAVWPTGNLPAWAPLAAYAQPGAEFGRAEAIAFCERFIIELSLPTASSVLAAPGSLEGALVEELSERVGIGRYPNHGRLPADVAALAISLANLARTQESSLTPADVERELEIRTDFGRVAQAFPLDESLFHDRPTFRRTVREAALAGVHQLVLGPPGAGKSWELTRLASELSDAGAIVARHYCYLEPGDELVERRVTTDVFFGNLLGDLVDAEPELLGAGGSRYAAGLPELEAMLAKAAASGRPVVLLVDGLDHIARVRADARSLDDDDTDIVERLATLYVPTGVAVVIGSQPGQHLEPLNVWGGLVARQVPAWLPQDLAALAARHGVTSALAAVGVTDNEETTRVYRALAERADGNPLYARYLARGLVSGLHDGTIANPHDWIAEAPAIAGDLGVYYAHIYRAASAQAQAIADVLGVIDFAVTEEELREMLRALLGAWVPQALARLAPVLTSAAGQGGVRVFHESFRRFMTQELAHQGRSPADALEPVIDWLKARGFYRDAKSYRFLLPALRRAGRGAEVLAQVNIAFVSESVAQAHPLDAIQRNLALAADVAGRLRNWPALVRCVELHRSAYTCFDGSQNTWRDYWATYLTLFGPAALSERLLFDGRPTQSRYDGLHACALIDDAGGTAPWREYLNLPSAAGSESRDTFDENGGLTEGESEALAAVHGVLRLGDRARVVRWLINYLRRCGNEFKPLFVRRVAARLARMLDTALLERIARRSEPARRGGARMTLRAAAVIRLSIADEHARVGDRAAAAAAATLALDGADSPELAAACLAHGAPADRASDAAVDPAGVSIAVGPDDFLHDANGVRAWVASVRLWAADAENGGTVLEVERQRVNGMGWYRCWLRFVLGLARAEAAQRRGEAGDVIRAFDELTRDVHPFRGKPRPCDLFTIRRVIRETIAWGLLLLRSETEWRAALGALAVAAEGTGSRLDREDGGPLSTGMLLEVLMPHAADPVGGTLVRDAIEQHVARLDAVGTYYPTHADYAMCLARARLAGGQAAFACDAWARGAIFFAGYGWRKDGTVFDVIESAPALLSVSRRAALQALADAQPLANAVLAHTDGRSTNKAPNAWLRNLLAVHPAVGVALLARTIIEEDGTEGWPTIRAVRDVAEEVRDTADPALVDALLATLRFEVESEGESIEAADARLAPVVRLASVDRLLAARAIRRVAAEVSGDGRRYTAAAAQQVGVVAAELDLPVPHIGPPVAAGSARPLPTGRSRYGGELRMRVPAFSTAPTFVDLLAGLRAAGRTRPWNDPEAWDNVVLALSYHVGRLVDEGLEHEARRLLRFFARDTYVAPSGTDHPLGKLAAALDAAGYVRVAAVAYALAYTATRGGMGWLQLGDQSHGHLITRAVALDAEAARQVVADEVGYSLRGNWYSAGTSRHLVERLAGWGEAGVAEAAWREAFAVVAHRLPLAPTGGWFSPLDLNDAPEWTVDESLIALLLARLSHPQLTRKNAALAGVVRAIQRRPEAVTAPLRWWLTRNAHVTSVLLVLDTLWRTEVEPFPVTRAIEDVLTGYAGCELWGVRRLSVLLLERAGLASASTSARYVNTTQRPDGEGLTPQQQRALLRLDVGRTLERLLPFWPEVRGRVVRRLHALLGSTENHRQRSAERYRLSYGRDGKSLPPTPVLLWESELFEVALHEELNGLAAHLWATGQWARGVEDSLISVVLPNTNLHLSLAASRTARPAWPLPVTLTDGLAALSMVADDDPLYVGWTRLAVVERQYVSDPERPYHPPTEAVTLFAGAHAVPLGTSIRSGAFRLAGGDVNDWWRPDAPSVSFPPRLPLGPLVRLNRATDWLGDAWVLIPPLELRSYLQLEPPRYAEPMMWSDSTGVAVVALRTWTVLNAEALHAEPVECVGADVIMRPDAFERLLRLYSIPLRELRTVWRQAIPRAADEAER